MSLRQQFWLKAICIVQGFILVVLLSLIFLLTPRGDKFFGPQLCLKEIHDSVISARKSGKVLSKDDVEKKVAELQQEVYFQYFKPEIVGSGANWILVWAPARKHQSKFENLIVPNDDPWPAVIMSSQDDGFLEISPYGQITHRDFNW